MLGRIIGMVAGRTLGRQFGGASAGPLGMAAGMALPYVLRRFGPLGMVGAAVGGYAVKKYLERNKRSDVTESTSARYPGRTDPNLGPS